MQTAKSPLRFGEWARPWLRFGGLDPAEAVEPTQIDSKGVKPIQFDPKGVESSQFHPV